MPARVRVERPRQHRFGFWNNVKWVFATGFIGLFTGTCGSFCHGATTVRPGSGEAPFSAGGFLVVFGLTFLVTAWRTGRLQKLFADPIPEPVVLAKDVPDERDLALSEGVFLGTSLAEDRTTPVRVYLDHATRNRHVYLIGKTRTGKTSVMKNMIEQDMRAGHGLAFLDPHGDAAEDLAGLVPEDRLGDVVYFDPTKEEAPAFNPFALGYPVAKLAEDVVSVFEMLVGDSWGPRLEHILRFSVMTLVADKRGGHTIADLKTLLLDEAYRGQVLSGVDNRQLLEFWSLEFPTMPAAAVSPILNKLSAFLAPMSHLERVFSAPRNDLDFTAIMDEGKILIVNLSKGVLGDEPSRLLGGLLVTGIQQAALFRATQKAATRRDFYLYVDEFQNYTVSSFADILSESAKYRLNLTLAHQNLGQIPDYLRRSIFGNVATLVAYQVSAQDAPILAKEMHRSRIVVREKSSNDPMTLDAFVHEQSGIYLAARADPLHGMSRHDELRFASRYQIPSPNAARAGIKNQQAGEELQHRRSHIERALSVFRDDTIDLGALKNLFPDYEFRDQGFPTVNDFVNLPPHQGFVRIGTAQNVRPLAPPRPADPDPEIQRAVMGRRWRDAAPEVAPSPVTQAGEEERHAPESAPAVPANTQGSDDFVFGSYDSES